MTLNDEDLQDQYGDQCVSTGLSLVGVEWTIVQEEIEVQLNGIVLTDL